MILPLKRQLRLKDEGNHWDDNKCRCVILALRWPRFVEKCKFKICTTHYETAKTYLQHNKRQIQ